MHWEGIRASTIAELVKPKPSARYVTFQSLEAPYVDQLTREQFELKDTMLARHMNGKPVTRAHGAPLRMVVPQMYGYKGVKWVKEIRYDAQAAPGFWEQRGYDIDAWVGTLEWPRLGPASCASRAPSGPRTGCWRHVLRDARHRPVPERVGALEHPRPADGEGLAPLVRRGSASGSSCSSRSATGARSPAPRATSTASTATTDAG